jgi:hypothetical protein
MIQERLVSATVRAAMSIAKEPATLKRVLSEQAAWVVGQMLAPPAQRIAPTSDGAIGRCAQARGLPIGWDAPGEEGQSDVPWYAS